MNRRQVYYELFLVSAFAALLLAFFNILSPFFTPLFLAWVLWIVALPLDRFVARRFKRLKSSWRAGVSTLLVLAIFVIPIVSLLNLFVNELKNLIPQLQQTVDAVKIWAQNPTWDQWPMIQKVIGILDRYPALPKPSLDEKIAELITAGVNLITSTGRAIAANTATLVFYLFVILFTLFYLFRDGRRWTDYVVDLIPLRKEAKHRIGHTIHVTVADIVRGSFLTSLIQTAIAMVGYLIIGLPAAITLGLATGLASFIPAIGSALIWIPVALFLLAKGLTGQFIFMVIWGAVAISSSDNILRTFFIGQAVQIPILLMFLALVGGVLVHGAMGLLIGPVIVAVLPLFADIYKEVFFRSLDDSQDDKSHV